MSANQRPNSLHGGGNSPAFSSDVIPAGPSSDSLRRLLRFIANDIGIEIDTDNPITMTREVRKWVAQQKDMEKVRQSDSEIARLEAEIAVADIATEKLKKVDAEMSAYRWKRLAFLLVPILALETALILWMVTR